MSTLYDYIRFISGAVPLVFSHDDISGNLIENQTEIVSVIG